MKNNNQVVYLLETNGELNEYLTFIEGNPKHALVNAILWAKGNRNTWDYHKHYTTYEHAIQETNRIYSYTLGNGDILSIRKES